jgi:hypothetical protein
MRPHGSRNWEMPGDGYVHGLIKGEACDEGKCTEFQFI